MSAEPCTCGGCYECVPGLRPAECVDCGKLRELGWDDRCQDCGDAWERQPRYEMRWDTGAPEVWTLAQAKREGLDLARLAIGEEIPLYDCDGSARRVS